MNMSYFVILIVLLAGTSYATNDISKKIQLRDDLVPVALGENTSTYLMRNVLASYAKSLEDKSNSLLSSPYGHLTKLPEAHVGSKIPALGSSDSLVYKGVGDYGLFTTIFASYSNHWALRTMPDDWWYTIIKTIAVAIDENAENESVRNFFVDHKGKKELVIEVYGTCTPHDVDYSWFFDQMTTLIQNNVKVPGYVDSLRSDFTTSTPMHKIISEITVMTSTQQYFDYTMTMIGCGIPHLEMLGSEDDWIRLKEKLLEIKQLLKPIETEIGLRGWWRKVEVIFDKLLDTFRGDVDADWWGHIFKETEIDLICAKTTGYGGWFITDLLNQRDVQSLNDLRTGLVTVPMKLKRDETCGGGEEKSALVAGIAGMKIDTESEVPIVQAQHAWSLFVEPESVYAPQNNY